MNKLNIFGLLNLLKLQEAPLILGSSSKKNVMEEAPSAQAAIKLVSLVLVVEIVVAMLVKLGVEKVSICVVFGAALVQPMNMDGFSALITLATKKVEANQRQLKIRKLICYVRNTYELKNKVQKSSTRLNLSQDCQEKYQKKLTNSMRLILTQWMKKF
jgi:uncharacterized membrane protein